MNSKVIQETREDKQRVWRVYFSRTHSILSPSLSASLLLLNTNEHFK